MRGPAGGGVTCRSAGGRCPRVACGSTGPGPSGWPSVGTGTRKACPLSGHVDLGGRSLLGQGNQRGLSPLRARGTLELDPQRPRGPQRPVTPETPGPWGGLSILGIGSVG
ncbi:Hypothetical predicted protein [Marmota monax]|uniref:Uncharacterized protein n=1 Tax=Marmota monax TaxID=9995 RepID=A0A5E4A319_MARMO|nr:hypothetical protein GHT09_019674 [Marmota monax]VTJ51607.1 Hypothetical predicted protein [Marmota monax]